MRFVRFGVTLERIGPGHLELVRRWRNSDWVRPFMRHREVIEESDQVRWFGSLDAQRDWYFCAHADEEPFGLFHIKAVDWTQRCGEAGAFVGDPGFIGRPEPAQATLAMMDFAFLLLDLESLEAQYNLSLPRMVHFNAQLGYAPFREEPDGFARARITSVRYFTQAGVFRRAAAALHGTEATLSAPDAWLAGRIADRRERLPDDFQLRQP
jgi:hypothetical protein